MSEFDKTYLGHVCNILENGIHRGDRTGNGTISTFGTINTFDVSKDFPLLTTKSVDFSKVLTELLWFIRGDINIKYLLSNNCGIWNKDAYRYYSTYIVPNAVCLPLEVRFETRGQFIKAVREGGHEPIIYVDSTGKSLPYTLGDLGPVYGKQWNSPAGLSGEGQLDRVIREIKENPDSRRLLVSAWDPEDMWGEEVALPCCHYSFQFYVRGESLDIMYNMRSNDVFLGQPYNIASYAALLYAVCKLTGKTPGIVKQVTGDAHIYNGHLDALEEQCARALTTPAPRLSIADRGQADLSDFIASDFILEGYDPQGPIQAEMFT